MNSKERLQSIPKIVDADITLERMEAELATANTRVKQATERRDEILEAMGPKLKERAISDLLARGIVIGKTIVLVRDEAYWGNARLTECFVMGVDTHERYSERFTDGAMHLEVFMEFAKVKKDGTPSKAPSGIYRPQIVKVVSHDDDPPTMDGAA